MRYHNITTDDMLNGDGLRTVLWVAGCEHCCERCHNPETWDINGGIVFDEEAEKELFDKLGKPYISGLTFSGGDPLHTENRTGITRLAKKIRSLFPEKTIWLYSGYMWEQVCELEIMKYVDVFVDGLYIDAFRDVQLYWRGSSNQRVIDTKKTIAGGEIVLHCK